MQAINDSHRPRPGSTRPGPIGLLIRMGSMLPPNPPGQDDQPKRRRAARNT
jgi:hypothetical protein